MNGLVIDVPARSHPKMKTLVRPEGKAFTGVGLPRCDPFFPRRANLDLKSETDYDLP